MGVMPCRRNGCESILCSTYIYDIGYICNECQEEFKKYLEDNNKHPKTDMEIKRELKMFMGSDKDTYAEGNDMTVDEYFNKHNRNKERDE